MELLGAVVIDEDVEGEDVFDGADGEVLVEEGGHGGVVEGEDGDGEAAVDLTGEVRQGEVVVEGAELGVLGEDFGDVVGVGGGGEEEEDEEQRERQGGGGEGERSAHGGGRWRRRRRRRSAEERI